MSPFVNDQDVKPKTIASGPIKAEPVKSDVSIGIQIRDLTAERILDRLRFLKEKDGHLDSSEITAISNFLAKQGVEVLQQAPKNVLSIGDNMPNYSMIRGSGPVSNTEEESNGTDG